MEEGIGTYRGPVRDSDVAWTEQLFRMMKHGAVWAVPHNQCVYRIDKEQKRLVLISGQPDELHERTKQVCARFGYTVVELEGENL